MTGTGETLLVEIFRQATKLFFVGWAMSRMNLKWFLWNFKMLELNSIYATDQILMEGQWFRCWGKSSSTCSGAKVKSMEMHLLDITTNSKEWNLQKDYYITVGFDDYNSSVTTISSWWSAVAGSEAGAFRTAPEAPGNSWQSWQCCSHAGKLNTQWLSVQTWIRPFRFLWPNVVFT
jgi:hypothetical protein